MSKKIFFIGGLADIDIATNQSLKNTIKYLSEFGHDIHFFGAFPKNYPILQDPTAVFGEKVVFHRSPNFLTSIFNFGKSFKDFFGMPRSQSKPKEETVLKPTQKTSYYDEYNFLGWLSYALFFYLYVPLEVIRVLFYSLRYKPELFYGIHAPGSVVATIVGKLLNKPIIHRWHGASYTEEDVLRIKKSLKEKLLMLDGSFAQTWPNDAMVVTNDGTQGEKIYSLMGVNPKKIHFWMNGMDLDDMKLPSDWNPEEFKNSLDLQGKKIMVMASRLVLWKRVDRGINALHRLVVQHKMDDVVLLVVGKGQELEKLKQIAEKLNVTDHVRFVGAVHHSEVIKYLSIADVFLSLYDVSNLGNPILEAMHCGLPIASIDDGSTAELLKDGYNSFLVPHEGLDEEFALKVKTLLTDESINKQFRENIKKTYSEKMISWKDRMWIEHEMIEGLISKEKENVVCSQ